MYGVIYKAVSKIDGRVYIGLSTNFKKRLNDYRYHRNRATRYFEYAIRKYGFENFEFYIIDYADNLELLNYKEKFWIRIYNSDIKGIGFNVEHGGNGIGKTSEETKKKISEANKGEKNSFYGKKHTPETRELISKANTGKFKGENNPFYGRHHSDKTKEILSIKNTGREYSDEYREKFSKMYSGENNPMFGKKHSEETKEKIKNKAIGRKVKEEAKQKMSINTSGEKNPSAKLNWQKVDEIRLNKYNFSRKQFAEKYGVGIAAIDSVIKNITWKIPQEEFDKKYNNRQEENTDTTE